MKSKTLSLVVLCAALLSLSLPSFAEVTSASEASLTAKTSVAAYKTVCSNRLLGLCAESGPTRLLSLGILSELRSRAAKAAPNKFFQLVKLFIDDMEVAQIGNTSIRLSIELK